MTGRGRAASCGFSQASILLTSVGLVILLCVVPELTQALHGADYHVAIVIVALFPPVTAMFQFILDVAAAYGGQLRAAATYRLLFPALLLTPECRRLVVARCQ